MRASTGKLAAVLSNLDRLRAYVQATADASSKEGRAILESGGMSVKRPRLHYKQPLAVKPGPVTGVMVIVAKAAGDRATYGW